MRRLLSALAVATGVAAAVLVSTAAHAAAGPTVLWANSVEGDFARIQIGAMAEAGVASLRVHVVSPVTHEDLAVVDSFHLVSGNEQYGWWQSDDVVILPDLGYYPLNSEITDNDGVHVAQQSVGSMVYAVQMFFKDLKVTHSVTYAKREVTVSGRLMGRWPGTYEVKAIEGRAVEMVTQYGNFVDGMSGNAGHFDLTTEVQGVDDSGYVTTLYDYSRPYYLQAYSMTEAPEVKQANTRITMDLDRDTVVSGETVTVSGVLSWKAPQEWLPVRNAYVALLSCNDTGYCGQVLGYTVTDEQGRYSLTVTPYTSARLQVGTYNYDPFVTSTTLASADLIVLQRAQFTDLSGSRDEAGKVLLDGHLQFPSYFTPFSIPVDIEFSKDGTGGWRPVTTVDIANNPTNPGGISFQVLLDEPGPGYWRASYAGDPTFFQSAVSIPVYVG